MSKKKSSKTEKPASEPADGLALPVQQKPYLVLARKYRPRTFDDLIGQDAMVRTLKNAFQLGRIAQAYMLTGVRGVGKTTTARILARALNYQRPGVEGPTVEIAELGEHCQAILESRHMDVVEMDAASNTGIDDIREIIESVKYMPAYARYKVFIIDEVHMLSKAAFNGLLKTLEEPPPHVKFIFATTEIRKVPVTVLSRCQRFDLKRIGIDALKQHFGGIAEREGQTVDDEALAIIARLAEGSVRDGLSLLDQAFALGRGTVSADDVRAMAGLADSIKVYDLLDTVFRGEAGEALQQLAALYDAGADPIQALHDLADAVHAIARIKIAGAAETSAAFSQGERERAQDLAARLGVPALARAWQMLLKGIDEAARAPRAMAAAEMVIIRLCYASDLPEPGELVKRLLEGGSGEPSRTPEGRNGGQQDGLLLHGAPATARLGSRPLPAGVKSLPSGDGDDETGDAGEPGEALDDAPPSPLASFADVVALASKYRDVQLKIALEEHVSLVRFRHGHIELKLLERAPKNLAILLSRKLQEWTGELWMVSLSDMEGERPLAEVRREEAARLLAQAKRHPAVQAVFQHFPEAEITSVRPLSKDAAPGKSAQNKSKSAADDAK